MRNRKANVLYSFVTSSILIMSVSATHGQPVLDQQQHASTSAPEADSRIKLLLNRIEIALAQDEANFDESLQMLMEADSLLPAASDIGQQLITQWPLRLQAQAKEQRDAGSLMKPINYTAFAGIAAQYIKEQQEHRKPIRVTAPEKPDGLSAATTPSSIATAANPANPGLSSPEQANPDTRIKVTTARLTAPKEADPLPTTISPIPIAKPPDLPRPEQPTISAAAVHTLLERGNMMLAQRNVSAARMLFARAASAGVGIAALKLADTYDPGFIAEHNLVGIKGDLLQAEAWYRKAAAMGEGDAEQRLKILEGRKRALAGQ